MDEKLKEILKAFLGKKYDIIEVLCANADKNGICRLTIAEISKLSNSSKPTIIACLKELESKKILNKLGNGCYEIKFFKFS